MPALPSKGKSRDLSVATLIPVSAYGVVKRLGSPDEEQHALLLFLSDSGNGGRAGSLGCGVRDVSSPEAAITGAQALCINALATAKA